LTLKRIAAGGCQSLSEFSNAPSYQHFTRILLEGAPKAEN
jgi:hypothetical protein